MIPLLLSIQLISSQLSADRTDYDGKTLTFTGKFELSHPLGTIYAEKATLENLQMHPRTSSKTFPLSLENGVKIISFQEEPPISISADHALSEIPALFTLTELQEARFFKDVEIKIFSKDPVTARGGSALYTSGSMTLYPSLPKISCQLLQEDNRIDAAEMSFHFKNQEVHCQKPKGIFPRHALEFSAQTLQWKKGHLKLNGSVTLKQSELFVEAERGELICSDQLDPKLMILEGDVRLVSSRIQDKLSFAAADRVVFDPIEKTLVFSSSAPKKVLFWQEGLFLSANQVRVDTKKESIQGDGDVHFTFNPEEKNYIEELFSKYL
ncbi:MAG: hypothetical protein V4487_03020 [Chlamydiota bacterium]